MKDDKENRIINNEIKFIVDNIKIIDEQIETFTEIKPLFFQKKKLQKYRDRLENLEIIKNNLYKNLEYSISKFYK